MKKVGLTSFITGTETKNFYFKLLANTLSKENFDLHTIVVTDQDKETIYDLNKYLQITHPGTKYSRIYYLLSNIEMDYFIFLDNDIKCDEQVIKHFIYETIEKNVDIAWGKIVSRSKNNLVEKLVTTDKYVSHFFLRPFLWKLRMGITVPGQCFMIKKEAFLQNFDLTDTFLDDISFGLQVRHNNLKFYMTNKVLGYEQPNEVHKNLFKQRKRWSKGFASIILGNLRNPKALLFLFVHLFAYHLLWIPFWSMIIFISLNYIYLGLIIYMTFILMMSRIKLTLFLSTVIYTIYFPLLHMYWLVHLCFNLIKRKTDKLGIG